MILYPLALPDLLANPPPDVPARPNHPVWLYPNLLSLDAPAVALAWLHIFSVTWKLFVPWEAYVALGLAVWIIYVADRLLDVSVAEATKAPLEARHYFHKQHMRWFLVAIAAALITAICLVVTSMPMAIYKNLLIGGVLVGGFFGLSLISSRDEHESPLLKNILAGFTFAYGTAMVAHIYRPELRFMDLMQAPEFLLFAVLCVLNISAIDLWEHSARSHDEEVKASDEISLTLPVILLAGASVFLALRDQNDRSFYYAILVATGLLYALNRRRHTLSRATLRTLADVTLLVPWVLFGFLSAA